MSDYYTIVTTEDDDTVVQTVVDDTVTTLIEFETGPQGPTGATGAQGVPGPVGDTYTHVQSEPASIWTVQHNLNLYPNITVVDSADTVVEGDVTYLDSNTIRVEFVGAFSGRAYVS